MEKISFYLNKKFSILLVNCQGGTHFLPEYKLLKISRVR